MRHKRILFYFTALLLALSAVAVPKITSHNKTVEESYNFWLAEPSIQATGNPSEADSLQQYPLIVFLHGASLCGNNLEKVKRYGTIDAVEKGRELSAYVLAPQNPGGSWNPKKIMALIEWVEQNHPIDTNRIYVLGMSLGGYGTIDLAATYPHKIAAAVGMCGGATVRDLSGLAELPLWIVHGTGDRAVSVAQSDKVVEAIERVDSLKSRLIYDRVPGMNHSKPARLFYLPEVYEWLFAHSLLDEGRPLQDSTIHATDELMSNAYKGLKFTGKKTVAKRKKSSARKKTRKKRSSNKK